MGSAGVGPPGGARECWFQNEGHRGAQLVKGWTLDFGSGQDLTVSPALGSAPTEQSLLGILSLPLSLPLVHWCSLSLSKIKTKYT